ncbi:TPA: hypothetical protein NJY86_002736 [Vibrio parahaemolyticus]|nr:hypothetical protein [Vibrio parahaemolyticus]
MFQALKRATQKEQSIIIGFMILASLAVGLPYLAKFWNYPFSSKISDWGDFGSYVGGLLSPLFAVGSLYYVVKTFRQQSFENTFNLLLEQHNSLADTLSTKQITAGDNTDKEPTSPIEITLAQINNYWLHDTSNDKISINDNYEIHKYIRVVYQVLKFIDENCPTDKLKYSRIFRSFISNDLNLILAINCAQRDSSGQLTFPKYKSMIDKYHLLEHLILLNPVTNTNIYDSHQPSNLLVIAGTYNPSAFGDEVNIRKALEVEFADYHKRLSKGLLRTSNTLLKYKKHTLALNEKFPAFLEELNEHASLKKKASQELYDLNKEIIHLTGYSYGIIKGEALNEEYMYYYTKMVTHTEKIIQDTCYALKTAEVRNQGELASAIANYKTTTVLHQYLDGMMQTIAGEINDVITQIEETVNLANS